MSDDSLPTVPTHIPGLDQILAGGFIAGGVYIVEGPPGAGKTTLGSQFCFGHAAAGGRALYVTLLAEQHTRLLAHLRHMAFFDVRLVPDRVSYISAFKVLENDGLGSVLKMVRHAIAEQKISAIVLDGLSSAEEAALCAKDFKKFIHELQIITSMTGCTALLLNTTERPGGSRPERTMVDGIIELEDTSVGQHAVRYLIARKMRGAPQVRGRHFMKISDAGLRVIPRIETSALGLAPGEHGAPGAGRLSVGITGVDKMLLGGIPERSITAVVGPSGSGKTILGMQFLNAGIAADEVGIYFGFFERPTAVLDKSTRLGLSLESAVGKGRLSLHWQRPIEGVIDLYADRLLEIVRTSRAKRLFIDGLQGFQAAATDPDRLREVLSCLTDELEALGVTTLYSSETPDLFGEDTRLSTLGMSAITHNIILLRHLERASETIRRISILKLRDGGHDHRISEFSITDSGIHLAALTDPSKGTRPASGAGKNAKTPSPPARKRGARKRA